MFPHKKVSHLAPFGGMQFPLITSSAAGSQRFQRGQGFQRTLIHGKSHTSWAQVLVLFPARIHMLCYLTRLTIGIGGTRVVLSVILGVTGCPSVDYSLAQQSNV